MWHTAEGTRTLEGAEARLFREAAWALIDAIRAEKNLGSKHGCFATNNVALARERVNRFAKKVGASDLASSIRVKSRQIRKIVDKPAAHSLK